ncbi:hypothetical protein BDA99DRAFT_558556 [Phascolomyces articulosus]|uniref:HIT-type domain-containing protein n=1 Tax=Phascolomyces articulosus TaxID=60185 RepID=A0AAD5KCC8_9FUNG|nr:hypothetical protein BDA99DRAFT_558556 [Phascolomyces articulosus]
MPSLRVIDQDDSPGEELQGQDQPLCNICQKQFSNYVCPRCNLRYCSLGCYKDLQHADCTESFYKDSITEEIRSRGTSDEEKQKMLQLLRRFEAENDQLATTHNEEEMDEKEDNDSMDDLHDRFATIDLDKADSEAIWALLSDQERKEFEALLQFQQQQGDSHEGLDDIPIPEYHPWWNNETIGSNKKVVIQELENEQEEEEEENTFPELPSPLPDLQTMMKSPPGPESDLVWSLMHTAMVYCYVMRHFLGDIREDVKDTVAVVSTLCKATLFSSTPGYAYRNPTEALYDLVDEIMDYEEQEASDRSRRVPLMIVLLEDCLSLMKKQDSMVRAISDLWRLLESGTKKMDKTHRNACFLATRKSYFYLGYAVYLSRNHGLERVKVLAMAEKERLVLEDQAFDRQRKAAEQAVELQQKQTKPKITNVL